MGGQRSLERQQTWGATFLERQHTRGWDYSRDRLTQLIPHRTIKSLPLPNVTTRWAYSRDRLTLLIPHRMIYSLKIPKHTIYSVPATDFVEIPLTFSFSHIRTAWRHAFSCNLGRFRSRHRCKRLSSQTGLLACFTGSHMFWTSFNPSESVLVRIPPCPGSGGCTTSPLIYPGNLAPPGTPAVQVVLEGYTVFGGSFFDLG